MRLFLLSVMSMLAACGEVDGAKAGGDGPGVPASSPTPPWLAPTSWREVDLVRHGRPAPVTIELHGASGRVLTDWPFGYTVREFTVDCQARRLEWGRGHGYDYGSSVEHGPDPLDVFVLADGVDRICADGPGGPSMTPAQAIAESMRRRNVRAFSRDGSPPLPPTPAAPAPVR